jgi:tetratricopeptide (TPR) repeat protein
MLLGDELRLAMDSAGPAAARDRYAFLKQRFSHRGQYDFGEWEVNLLAERYQGEGRIEEAIAIYQLNEEYFPESISIKFSIARILQDEGRNPEALEYYRKVLEINPNHRGAARQIAELEEMG